MTAPHCLPMVDALRPLSHDEFIQMMAGDAPDAVCEKLLAAIAADAVTVPLLAALLYGVTNAIRDDKKLRQACRKIAENLLRLSLPKRTGSQG